MPEGYHSCNLTNCVEVLSLMFKSNSNCVHVIGAFVQNLDALDGAEFIISDKLDDDPDAGGRAESSSQDVL